MTAMTRIEPRRVMAPPHGMHDSVPRSMRRRPTDGTDRLARMLTAHAARAGVDVAIDILSVEPWCSATFAGTVATLALTAPATPERDTWLAGLAEADLPMGRDVIANIAVEMTPSGHRLRVLICIDAANG